MKPYREAILSEGGLARLFRISNPQLSGERLVLWHSDGTLRADCFIQWVDGWYQVSLNVLTMRNGEPVSEKMDLRDEVHPAALLCYGIYWQYFRPL
jgi:hypothetical protein